VPVIVPVSWAQRFTAENIPNSTTIPQQRRILIDNSLADSTSSECQMFFINKLSLVNFPGSRAPSSRQFQRSIKKRSNAFIKTYQ
jgi:hypothetical protein